MPSFGLFSSFSIFIASTTTSPCPSLTSSPAFTSTLTILPGIGAVRVCRPSTVNRAAARRMRSFFSSRISIG